MMMMMMMMMMIIIIIIIILVNQHYIGTDCSTNLCTNQSVYSITFSFQLGTMQDTAAHT